MGVLQFMIFQLRGCSGSGKSWVVRQLLERYNFKTMKRGNDVRGYYSPDLNLYIVGRYTTACGGCDTIKTQDETVSRVLAAHNRGYNVLFEGMISSHIAGRYAELYKQVPASYFIFLNTPLTNCFANIVHRRKEKGSDMGKYCKNVENNYKSTMQSRDNMIKLGVPVTQLPLLSSSDALMFIWKNIKDCN